MLDYVAATIDPDIRVQLLPHATVDLEPDFWENYRYNLVLARRPVHVTG